MRNLTSQELSKLYVNFCNYRDRFCNGAAKMSVGEFYKNTNSVHINQINKVSEMSEKEYKWSPQNPSPSAIAKVKDPMSVPDFCPNCGSAVRLGAHEEVYGGRSFGKWPYVYICENRKCDSYVGIHPFTNIPLGTLANKETRDARKSCKPAFEKLWKTGKAPMSRNDAYAWLSEALKIPPSDCHFAMFNARLCEAAKKLCKTKYKELTGE